MRPSISFIFLVLVTASMLTLSPTLTPILSPTPVSGDSSKTILVTNTADSGSGTLRRALLDAQSGDTITFDPVVFLPEAPVTIHLTSGLPPLTQGNLIIDGSNAGVVLDGSMITDEHVNGLEIISDGNIIRGLQITNFPNAAVGLLGSAKNNIIGGDRDIGAGPLGQGNLLSGDGNFGVGIWDADTSFNTIIGNYIGTDFSGTEAWSIHRDGVHINRASHNQVVKNLISGNGQSGVYICCAGEGNTLRENYVGTDISGLNPLGNLQSGICIDQGARDNVIGPDNIISYNNENGIIILGYNSLSNNITQNNIHDNELLGIYLWMGGNTELTSLFIFDFDLDAGTLTGITYPNCTVEIFSDSSNEGEVYEGRTTADSTGVFTFNKGASFTGPHLTATATDAEGNTSPFSAPTSGTRRSTILQEGNILPVTQLQPRQSRELADNYIGGVAETEHIDAQVWYTGLKWMRVVCDGYGRWQKVDWDKEEYTIDPGDDRIINDLVNNGVKTMYVLDVWHTENRTVFYKTEEDIERYLNYVRLVVHHFKGRIEYYEILNEPDLDFSSPSGLPLPYYVNLIKRTFPVIREEDPEAKIVVGAIPDTRFNHVRDYMWGLLRSEVMPFVDGFSWHPMYGAAPSDDPRGVRQQGTGQMANYWENYTSLVGDIMNVASSNGFKGEYIVEEMLWRTPSEPHESEPYGFTDTTAAKYYARAIIIHRGLNVTTGLAEVGEDERPQSYSIIRNLCNVMAGAKTITLPINLQSEAKNIRNYSFSLPNGDKLIALWTDGVAVDEDPGVKADIRVSGFTDWNVVGIDPLRSFQQPIVSSSENGDMVIQNLIVKDYPMILRLTTAPEPTSISISLLDTTINGGESVTVSGSISPAISGATVHLNYRKAGEAEVERTVTTAPDGSFSDTYMPDVAGSWSVEASWEGDVKYAAATSQTLEFTVVEIPPMGSLQITVQDKDGEPINGATVSSTSQPSGQQTLSGSSGTDGSVLFSDLESGSYTFQASKSGYVTNSSSVSVSVGETTELIITIETEPEPEEEKTGGGGIPGFPYESIILGLVFGILMLWMHQRRQ
jgi:parallel beta-helix repeat protein